MTSSAHLSLPHPHLKPWITLTWFLFFFLFNYLFIDFATSNLGCHTEDLQLQYMGFSSQKVKVTQLCPTLCNPMDYTVHGILQARILEWVGFPYSRGSSWPRDRTLVMAGGFFTYWAIRDTASSPTRDQTHTPMLHVLGAHSLGHWTTREVPTLIWFLTAQGHSPKMTLFTLKHLPKKPHT